MRDVCFLRQTVAGGDRLVLPSSVHPARRGLLSRPVERVECVERLGPAGDHVPLQQNILPGILGERVAKTNFSLALAFRLLVAMLHDRMRLMWLRDCLRELIMHPMSEWVEDVLRPHTRLRMPHSGQIGLLNRGFGWLVGCFFFVVSLCGR